jgi:hypothetical protein
MLATAAAKEDANSNLFHAPNVIVTSGMVVQGPRICNDTGTNPNDLDVRAR